MENNSIFKLTNPEFPFEFDGKTYQIKKANLGTYVQWQKKSQEILATKSPTAEIEVLGYAIYLILKDKIEGLTPEQVLNNITMDIDVLKCLEVLGFTKSKPVETPKVSQEIESPVGESSSS